MQQDITRSDLWVLQMDKVATSSCCSESHSHKEKAVPTVNGDGVGNAREGSSRIADAARSFGDAMGLHRADTAVDSAVKRRRYNKEHRLGSASAASVGDGGDFPPSKRARGDGVVPNNDAFLRALEQRSLQVDRDGKRKDQAKSSATGGCSVAARRSGGAEVRAAGGAGGASAAAAAPIATGPRLEWFLHEVSTKRYAADVPPLANAHVARDATLVPPGLVAFHVANYLVDVDWLLTEAPFARSLREASDGGVFVYGARDSDEDSWHSAAKISRALKEHCAAGRFSCARRISWGKPHVPAFGTHHSKVFMLFYAHSLRVIISTANLLPADYENKTQGVWIKDFDRLPDDSADDATEFGTYLREYYGALSRALASSGARMAAQRTEELASKLSRFDYSAAGVRLVATVPGVHVRGDLLKWGHMRVRSLLADEPLPEGWLDSASAAAEAGLVFQFSSFASIPHLPHLVASFSMSRDEVEPAGRGEDAARRARRLLQYGDKFKEYRTAAREVRIVWPTMQQVRDSIEDGWNGGSSLPNQQKSYIVRGFDVRSRMCIWDAAVSGRTRIMPHIKTFLRHRGAEMAYVLMGSHNMSRACWGDLQVGSTEPMLTAQSFELAVLVVPSMLRPGRDGKRRGIYSLYDAAAGDDACRVPLPYALPPATYASQPLGSARPYHSSARASR